MATNKKESAVGLGLAALAAAAAGAYFLYGKSTPKQKKKIKGWMLRMKGEVMDGLEGLRDVSEESYDKIVDKVSKKYEQAKNIDKSEVDAISKELKGYWKNISKHVMQATKTPPKK
ncbi:MAG: hypothetical protein AAB710_01145 [Patescibacteria group bacterium]